MTTDLLPLFAVSAYAEEIYRRWPELLEQVDTPFGPAAIRDDLRRRFVDASTEDRMLSAIRRVRHRELIAIAWRDIANHAPVWTVLDELSNLADLLVHAVVERSFAELCERLGKPLSHDGRPQRPVVFGLGKLGGQELNFSSDIDLIMAFPESGQTDGKRPLSNEEFFARLVPMVTRRLGKVTADGFAYRVDWRLRPFGSVGRPALSFAAMENYYQRDGRDWERYAWIKARPVAGDLQAGHDFLQTIRPFIYPRYLDYTAFDQIRQMKSSIEQEVQRKDLRDNIKLGPGGIREIEFVAQAFQLIRGGVEPRLRGNQLRPTLAMLAELGLLEQTTSDDLKAAYVLLRRVENRFQQVADEQTHTPPNDDVRRDAIASSLGFADWKKLNETLTQQRQRVTSEFRAMFAGSTPTHSDWSTQWQAARDEEDSKLAPFGAEPWRQARLTLLRAERTLGERARRRLNQFAPSWLGTCANHANPDDALDHSQTVIQRIATRSAYLALLVERPAVLTRLVDLCAASPWLAELLAEQPMLLDELIDPRLFVVPDRQAIAAATTAAMKVADGSEAELQALNEVKQRCAFAIACARLDQRIDPVATARCLTVLAEVLLGNILLIAERDLADRYGQPSGSKPQFAVIGYGSLGAEELNFQSDLDLIFLYDGIDTRGETRGQRPLSNLQFLARLGQRIVHLLTSKTRGGRLYEVDTRLRPNGNSGLLVSSLESFAAYQHDEAWTWELLALTRARWVAGDKALAARFSDARHRALGKVRDRQTLRNDARHMREKMRQTLDRSGAKNFDLKHGLGGKVDLEFISQYQRLIDRDAEVPTTTYAGLAGIDQAAEAYTDCLALLQAQALAQQPGIVPLQSRPASCVRVAKLFDNTFASTKEVSRD